MGVPQRGSRKARLPVTANPEMGIRATAEARAAVERDVQGEQVSMMRVGQSNGGRAKTTVTLDPDGEAYLEKVQEKARRDNTNALRAGAGGASGSGGEVRGAAAEPGVRSEAGEASADTVGGACGRRRELREADLRSTTLKTERAAEDHHARSQQEL